MTIKNISFPQSTEVLIDFSPILRLLSLEVTYPLSVCEYVTKTLLGLSPFFFPKSSRIIQYTSFLLTLIDLLFIFLHFSSTTQVLNLGNFNMYICSLFNMLTSQFYEPRSSNDIVFYSISAIHFNSHALNLVLTNNFNLSIISIS